MVSEPLGWTILSVALLGFIFAVHALLRKKRIWLLRGNYPISVLGFVFVSLSWMALGLVLAFTSSLDARERFWMFEAAAALALIGMAFNLLLTGQLKLKRGASRVEGIEK